MFSNKRSGLSSLFCLLVMGLVFLCFAAPGLTTSSTYIGGYYVYYGLLHGHSTISDGTGTPDDAYRYARDIAGLDFFSLADHAEQMSSTEWTNLKNTADSYNIDGSFVTFYGFEWSSPIYGHVAVINTSDYTKYTLFGSENTFRRLCNWLNAREGIAFLNHPGREDDFSDEFYNFDRGPYSDKVVGMELFNKNDGFSRYYYNDGYKSNDGNKGYYDEGLTLGWKLGAAGSDDNHDGTWGTKNNYRLAVLAYPKSRASIYDALKNRRFFSTLDKNLALSFKINGSEMGSIIAPGSYSVQIEASDAELEVFTKVQLIKNGIVINTWTIDTTNPQIMTSVTAAVNDYYYVKVTQTDGNEAISSPIFIR